MTKVVVMGHGGYGSAVKRNMDMLIGVPEDFRFVDFDEQDDLTILRDKIGSVLSELGDVPVLFACDVIGSPFREAAVVCTEHPGWAVVSGLNTAAYSEMTFNLELDPQALGELAMDTVRQTLLIFPQKDS